MQEQERWVEIAIWRIQEPSMKVKRNKYQLNNDNKCETNLQLLNIEGMPISISEIYLRIDEEVIGILITLALMQSSSLVLSINVNSKYLFLKFCHRLDEI